MQSATHLSFQAIDTFKSTSPSSFCVTSHLTTNFLHSQVSFLPYSSRSIDAERNVARQIVESFFLGAGVSGGAQIGAMHASVRLVHPNHQAQLVAER